MTLKQKISLAKEIQQQLNISGIWPNFNPVPFILYDNENQVAIGGKWPGHFSQHKDGIWVAEGFDPLLMGNTSVNYHGTAVAIWDTRTWPNTPGLSVATSGVVHEMFHAHQQLYMNLPWANELVFPQYPHSSYSIALALEENKRLEEILKNPSHENIHKCLTAIATLRKLREAEIGTTFMEYDKHIEGIEGTAAYVETHTKARIEGATTFTAANSYLAALSGNRLLNNYRHRCYASGLVLCLAADILWPGWPQEWVGTNKSIFDWVVDKLPPSTSTIEVSPVNLYTADKLLVAYLKQKEDKIAEFMNQPLVSYDGKIELIGFDPMNLVCIGNLCLHMHGKLRFCGKEHMIETPFLEEFGDNIMVVKRVLLPASSKI